MKVKGSFWKEGKFWIVEIPCLDISTQGKNKSDAFKMIADAILELVESYFGKEKRNKLKISAPFREGKKHEFGFHVSNSKILISLILIRQRELSHSTVLDAAQRLEKASLMIYNPPY